MRQSAVGVHSQANYYITYTLLGWHACALDFFTAVAGALVLTAHDLWEHAVVWLFHADKPLVHAAYAGSWHLEWVAEAALLLLLVGTSAFSALALRRYVRSRANRSGTA